MKNFEKKLEELKNLPSVTNKVLFPVLIDEIEELKNKNLSLREIYFYIKEKLPTYKVSYDSFRKFYKEHQMKFNNKSDINIDKKNKDNKENKKGEKMKKEKKFILLANDKGGVGKTTLATLLNLPNSLILNLDKTREIAHIYPYKRIADFGIIEKMENIDLEDYLYLLNDRDDIEYVIIDTKGGITEDLVKVLPYVDSVIVPIKIGSLSEEPSYGFIVELKAALDSLNSKNVKWAIVYNDISPKFLKKTGLAKYELLDEFKEMEKALKNEVLGDNLKTVTYFKRSEAIITREKEKKDIDELMKKNFGAYLPIKNEIERLNKELSKAINNKENQ